MINESIENIPTKKLKTILSSLQTSQLNQTPFTEIINSKNNLTKLFNPDTEGAISFRRGEFIRTKHADCANEWAPTVTSTLFTPHKHRPNLSSV